MNNRTFKDETETIFFHQRLQLKKHRKYFVILVAILCCGFILSSCKSMTFENSETSEDSFTVDNDTESTYVGSVTDSTADYILSPENAVEIFMNQKEKWIEYHEDSYPGSFAYTFLDLDFDGVLELIYTTCEGSGCYSYNKHYRIDPTTQTVEELSYEAYSDEYDYYYVGEDKTILLKNNENKTLFYYCLNYCHTVGMDYTDEFGKLYMKDGFVKIEKLHYKSFTRTKKDDGNLGDYTVTSYGCYKQNLFSKVTEDEYNQTTSDFFAENINLNLSWSCIEGNEFNSADESKQKQMLLDSYKKFSYDGFSFTDTKSNNKLQ